MNQNFHLEGDSETLMAAYEQICRSVKDEEKINMQGRSI